MRWRSFAIALLALALALVAVAGLVSALGSNDRSASGGGSGPGRAMADRGHRHLPVGSPATAVAFPEPATSGPHVPAAIPRDGVTLSGDQLLTALEGGDVVVIYGSPGLRIPLQRLASRLGATFSPSLAASGQAVVLDHDPRLGAGVLAVAWRHLQRAAGPEDPGLGSFIEFWLGRGTPR